MNPDSDNADPLKCIQVPSEIYERDKLRRNRLGQKERQRDTEKDS